MNANNYLLTKQAMNYSEIENILKHHKNSGRLIEEDSLPRMRVLSPELGAQYDEIGLKALGPTSAPEKGLGEAYPEDMRGKMFVKSIADPEQKKIFEYQGANTNVLNSKEAIDTHDALMMGHERKEIELGNKIPQSALGQNYGHVSMSGVVGGNDNNFVYGANKTLKDMFYDKTKNMKFSNNSNNNASYIGDVHPDLAQQMKVVDGTKVLTQSRKNREEDRYMNYFQPTHMVTPEENRGFRGLSKVEQYVRNRPAIGNGKDLLSRNIESHSADFGKEKMSKKHVQLMTDKELGMHNMDETQRQNQINLNLENQKNNFKNVFDYDAYNKWKQQ